MPLNKTGSLIGGLSGLASGTAQWLSGGRDGQKSFYNVEKFKSELNVSHGLYKPTLFFVDIAMPDWVTKLTQKVEADTAPGFDGKGLDKGSGGWLSDSNKRLQFFCSSANLPGMQILTSDYRRQGMGTFDRRPFGVQVTDIPLTFMLDNRGWILKLFYQWTQAIVNTDLRNTELGVNALDYGLFEFGYRNEYISPKITITTLQGTQDGPQESEVGNDQVDRDAARDLNDGVGVQVVQYELHEAFPIQIGDVSVAWNAENSFATLPVQFTFRGYNIKQLPTGKNQDPRGFSISEWIGIIGSAINIGSQIFSNRPNSVGSAINLLTNTKLFYNVTKGLSSRRSSGR